MANSNGVTWYSPPVAAPAGSSWAAENLRIQAHGVYQGENHPAYKVMMSINFIATSVIFSSLDLLTFINPFRNFDSIKNETHNFISIAAFPVLSLGIPFGYLPKWDNARANLNSLLDNMGVDELLLPGELYQITQMPNFWQKVQKSSWLKNQFSCRTLIASAFENNDRILFRRIIVEARRNNLSFHEILRDNDNVYEPIPSSFFRILIELGMNLNDCPLWNKLLHTEDANINDDKPLIDSVLQNVTNFDHVNLVEFLLRAQSERGLIDRGMIAKMFIRAGARVVHPKEIKEAFEWAQQVQNILNGPTDTEEERNFIKEQLTKIKSEIKSNSLIAFINYLVIYKYENPFNINSMKNACDRTIKNLQFLKNRILPGLFRMQQQVEEIEKFENRRMPYCSADEFQKRSRKVRTKEVVLVQQAMANSKVKNDIDNLTREIALYYLA